MIVYKITNAVNGKAYIGITVRRYRIRWHRHVQDAREGCPTPLHRAIIKYGKAAFRHQTLYEADSREEMLTVERGLIAAHGTFAPNGYNVTLGGGGTPGWKMSAETRRRISANRTGKGVGGGWKQGPEAREAIRAASHARSRHSNEIIAIVKRLMLCGASFHWLSVEFDIPRRTLQFIKSGRQWASVAPADISSIDPKVINGSELSAARRRLRSPQWTEG